MKHKVLNETELLTFLLNNFKELSNKKIKSLLKYNNILVNDKIKTKYNYLLKPNDIVSIKEYKTKKHNDNLKIIYEDKNIIILEKILELLTISTSNEKEKTLYHMVSEYIKQSNKKNRIFIVHRLDKDTSGLVVFCKNAHLRDLMQKNWGKVTRKYVAVVEGDLKDLSGSFKSYLVEDNNFKVHVTNSKNGKLAITNYKKLKSNFRYTLVEIEILTGRKNQIRVQFSQNGNPVVGDKKYSNRKAGNRLYLHSNKLEFIHPITKKKMNFSLPIPAEFDTIVK